MAVAVAAICVGAIAMAGERGLPVANGIHNFGKVDDTLYRGAQPDAAGITNLARLGVKIVISLQSAGGAWKQEEAICRANGIAYTNIPMKGLARPAGPEVANALGVIMSTNGPVFVHCEFGCDRTGTVVACYRIRHDQWSAVAAQNEADMYGMSRFERGMHAFIADFAKPGK